MTAALAPEREALWESQGLHVGGSTVRVGGAQSEMVGSGWRSQSPTQSQQCLLGWTGGCCVVPVH